MGSQRWVAPQEAYAKAHEALQKALVLDQTLGEAHSSLGWMSWRYDWNWPVAEKEFRLALELNPNYVAGQEQLAWFLAWSGRRDEALAELASMARLDFASSTRTPVESGVYYHQRDYKTPVEVSRKFITVNPDAWPSLAKFLAASDPAEGAVNCSYRTGVYTHNPSHSELDPTPTLPPAPRSAPRCVGTMGGYRSGRTPCSPVNAKLDAPPFATSVNGRAPFATREILAPLLRHDLTS